MTTTTTTHKPKLTEETPMATLKKAQDGYFTFVKRVEEPVLRFTGEMADSVARYVPGRPEFLAKMPTVSELVDNQLKFRKRLVDEQTTFLRKMVKAMDPMFEKMDKVVKMDEILKIDRVVKPTRPMSAKSTTTRTAPRRLAHKAA